MFILCIWGKQSQSLPIFLLHSIVMTEMQSKVSQFFKTLEIPRAKRINFKPGVMVHAHNPSPLEAEIEGLQVQG